MQVYKYTKNMDSEHFLEEWHPVQLDSPLELPFTSLLSKILANIYHQKTCNPNMYRSMFLW